MATHTHTMPAATSHMASALTRGTAVKSDDLNCGSHCNQPRLTACDLRENAHLLQAHSRVMLKSGPPTEQQINKSC